MNGYPSYANVHYGISDEDLDQRVIAMGFLQFMRTHGSSVLLNWGEDTDNWECSWITGDTRHCGFGATMFEAITQAMRRGTERHPPEDGGGC